MLLQIHLTPNAKHEKRQEHTDLLGQTNYKAWVTVPPVDGKANEALIRLISKQFDIPKSSISIIRGQTSRMKVVEIQK